MLNKSQRIILLNGHVMPKLRKNSIRNKIAIKTQSRNGKIVQTVNRKRIHHELKFIAFVCTAMDVWFIVKDFTAFVRYKNGIFRIVFVP